MESSTNYIVEAYHENQVITKISYREIRYFDNSIYKVLDCFEFLQGGDLFLDYNGINKVKQNVDKLEKKEKDFIQALDGYDMVELRFSTNV